MRRAVTCNLILSVGFLWGCSGPARPKTLPSPHHGGNLIELSDSRGFVELKTERGLPSKTARKSANQSRIVAYFYGSDATTVMSPVPTGVKVTIGPVGTGTVVDLAIQPKEPDEFTSEPGIYPDELRGQIEFQLDGKPIQAAFSFR